MTTKDDQAAAIKETYGVVMDQVYLDLDSRHIAGERHVRVLSTVSKPDQACCASCDPEGKHPRKTTWIRFDRLANPRLYRLVRTV